MVDANFLITYDPAHKDKAVEEASMILKEVKEIPKFYESGVQGVLLTKLANDPRLILKRLSSYCKKNTGKAYFTKRWIPIERWCTSDIEELGKIVKEFGRRIDSKKKWRMEISKRSYEKHAVIDMIMRLTEHVHNTNVDLKNPDLIVKIEILGRKAGVSLLEKHEIFDTAFYLGQNN
ncbi:MAG: THUMP domain-containing protein [Candidatus Aenigmatarchaeota archaeon]